MVIWALDEHRTWNPIDLGGATMKIGTCGSTMEVSAGLSLPVAVVCPWHDGHGGMQYVLFPVLAKDTDTTAIRVNGHAVFALKMLRDRDEVTIKTAFQHYTAYFSTESLPTVVRYTPEHQAAQNGKTILCPRCKLKVEPGQDVVRCPTCDIWYHEMPSRACWSYDQRCAQCQRPTAMTYAWMPEALHKTAPRTQHDNEVHHDQERTNAPV